MKRGTKFKCQQQTQECYSSNLHPNYLKERSTNKRGSKFTGFKSQVAQCCLEKCTKKGCQTETVISKRCQIVVIFIKALLVLLVLLLFKTVNYEKVNLVMTATAQHSDHLVRLNGFQRRESQFDQLVSSSNLSENSNLAAEKTDEHMLLENWKGEDVITREDKNFEGRKEIGRDEKDADAADETTRASKQLKKLLLRPRQILSSFVPQTLTKQLVIKRPETLMALNIKRIHEKLHNNGQYKGKVNYPPLKQLRIIHPSQQQESDIAAAAAAAADFLALQAAIGIQQRPALVSSNTNLLPNTPRQIVVVNKLPTVMVGPHQPVPQSRFMIDGRQLSSHQLQRLQQQQQQLQHQHNHQYHHQQRPRPSEFEVGASEPLDAERELNQIDQLIKNEFENRINLNNQIIRNQQRQLLVSYIRNDSSISKGQEVRAVLADSSAKMNQMADQQADVAKESGENEDENLEAGDQDQESLVTTTTTTTTWPPRLSIVKLSRANGADIRQNIDSLTVTRLPPLSSFSISRPSSSDPWRPTTEFPPVRASGRKNQTLSQLTDGQQLETVSQTTSRIVLNNNEPSVANLQGSQDKRKLSPVAGLQAAPEPFVPTALETIAQLRMNNNNNNNNTANAATHNNGQQVSMMLSKSSGEQFTNHNKTLLASSLAQKPLSELEFQQQKVPIQVVARQQQQNGRLSHQAAAAAAAAATNSYQQTENDSRESNTHIHTTTATTLLTKVPNLRQQQEQTHLQGGGGANQMGEQVADRLQPLQQHNFHTSASHRPLTHSSENRHPSLSEENVSGDLMLMSVEQPHHPHQQLTFDQKHQQRQQSDKQRNTLSDPIMTALSSQDDYLQRKDLASSSVVAGFQSPTDQRQQQQQQQTVALDETLRRLRETRARIRQLQAELSNSTDGQQLLLPVIAHQLIPDDQQQLHHHLLHGLTMTQNRSRFDESESGPSVISSPSAYDDDDVNTNYNKSNILTSSDVQSKGALGWFRVWPPPINNRTVITRAQNSLNLPLGMYHNGPLTAPARLVASAFGQAARDHVSKWSALSPTPSGMKSPDGGGTRTSSPILVASTLSADQGESKAEKASLSSDSIQQPQQQPTLVISNSKTPSFKSLSEQTPVIVGYKLNSQYGESKKEAGVANNSSFPTTMTSAKGDDQLLLNSTAYNNPISKIVSDNGNNNNNHSTEDGEAVVADGEVGDANWAQKSTSVNSDVTHNHKYKVRAQIDDSLARPPAPIWKTNSDFKQSLSLGDFWKPTSGHLPYSGISTSNSNSAATGTAQIADKRSYTSLSFGQNLHNKLINDSSLDAQHLSNSSQVKQQQQQKQLADGGKLTTERVLHTLIVFSCSVALICLLVIVALVRFQLHRQAKSRSSSLGSGGNNALLDGSSSSFVSGRSTSSTNNGINRQPATTGINSTSSTTTNKLILDGTMRNVSLLARQHHQSNPNVAVATANSKHPQKQQVNSSAEQKKHKQPAQQATVSPILNVMPVPTLNRSCCHCVTCSESWLFRESPPLQSQQANKASDGTTTVKQSCRSLCSSGFYHPAPRGKLPFGAASSVNKFLNHSQHSLSTKTGSSREADCSQPLAQSTCNNNNNNKSAPNDCPSLSGEQQLSVDTIGAIKGARAPIGGTRLRMMSAIDERLSPSPTKGLRGQMTSNLQPVASSKHQQLLLTQQTSENQQKSLDVVNDTTANTDLPQQPGTLVVQCTCDQLAATRCSSCNRGEDDAGSALSCSSSSASPSPRQSQTGSFNNKHSGQDSIRILKTTCISQNDANYNGKHAECNCINNDNNSNLRLHLSGPPCGADTFETENTSGCSESCCVRFSFEETSAKIIANCESTTVGNAVNSQKPNQASKRQASIKKGLGSYNRN